MMKKLTPILVIALLAIGIGIATAEKIIAGPKGGRILEKTSPKAEFFVEKDKTATITFYGNDMKPVPASDQIIAVVAEAKDGKQKIEFEKKGDVLVSKSKLPNVEDGNVVIQFKEKADAKPQNFRFKVNNRPCGECKRSEYACVCEDH